MTMLTKRILRLFTLSYLTANIAITAMEHQNQLQNPREKDGIIYFNCLAEITNKTGCSIHYATSEFHNIHLYNKPSNIQDPIVICDIVEPKTNFLLILPIPLKQIMDLSANRKKNKRTFYAKPGTINFETESFRNKPALFTITFTTNKHINGTSFPEQLHYDISDFIKNPSIIDPHDTQELEKTEIVTSELIRYRSNSGNIVHQIKQKKMFSHGPNGNGSSSEKLIVSAEMPANQNKFLSLRDREMHGCFKKS